MHEARLEAAEVADAEWRLACSWPAGLPLPTPAQRLRTPALTGAAGAAENGTDKNSCPRGTSTPMGGTGNRQKRQLLRSAKEKEQSRKGNVKQLWAGGDYLIR